MKASPLISSLNAGEFSPTLQGRSDIAKYANSCKLLQNFLPLIQGPSRRRGGSHYVTEVKSSANRTWLVRFEFSATQAWMLEFGDQYVRFYSNRGVVVVSGVAAYDGATAYVLGDLVLQGGVNYYCIASTTGNAPPNATYWYPLTGAIYEIPSPYLLADLTNSDGTPSLSIVQSGDVLYIANQNRTYAPRKLTRFGNTNWRFSTYQPNQGPFLELNTTTTTIVASAQTGSVTLTASAALFAATDVGRLVRLEVENIVVKPWETNKSYTTGDLAKYNGITYKATNTKTSGTAPPVHEHGTAADGQDGVIWQYQDTGYGVARITAYTDSTHVTASTVTDAVNGLVQFPLHVTTGFPTTRWQLGAWSATTEYPASVTFWRDRLWWGGKQRFWGSVPNDFENMAGDFFGLVGFDNAIWWQLQAEDVNNILWMTGDTKLVIGTPGGEFIGGEITETDPVGPSNFKTERQSKHRCRAVAPIAIGSNLIFVQRAGRKLLSMAYELAKDKFSSTDLAVLAERMTRAGIITAAYQAEPYSIIWCVLANGLLLGFTYDVDQDVTGWHRHPIGGNGIVESVSTVPSPDGGGDDLWLIVKRTINGATKRYVEYIARPWEGKDNDGSVGDAQSDAFYVDAGLTYSGAPATTISGLSHLEGQSVQVLVDGATHPDCTVSGGAITLNAAASVVQVGLKCAARMVSADLEAGGQFGTSQGKTSKIYRADVRFIDTLGGKIGRPDPDDLSNPSTLDDIDYRDPDDQMNAAPPIFTGIKQVTFPGDWQTEKRVEILADSPLPMTVSAIMPRMMVNDG